MRNLLRRRTPTALIIGLALFVVLSGARWAGWLQPLEMTAYDWLLQARAHDEAVEAVVVVGIGENDIAKLGTWPTPHGVLAEALSILLAMEPAAIAIDIYLDVPVPPGRAALDELLINDGRIVSAMKFGDGSTTRIPPAPVHVGTEQVGFTDMLLDPDATVRRALLFLDDNDAFALSLPFQAVLRYLAGQGVGPEQDPDNPELMRLGRTTFMPLEGSEGAYQRADAGGFQFLIDYRDRPEAIPLVSLYDVLEGRVTKAQIAGNVVLLGVTADSVKDLFFTPYSAAGGPQQTPGVVVHAQIASQLLRAALEGGVLTASIPESLEYVWLFLWTLGGALLALRVRAPAWLAVAGAIGLGAVALVAGATFMANLWIPLVPPAVGWLASMLATSAYLSAMERQDRQNLMSLFSKHVSPQLANAIWDQRDRFLSNDRPVPQRLVATCFFSDVVGFTPISEGLDPPQLMDWLNEYMALMSPRINEYDGVILRFIGDAIMAVFGVPVARTDEAEMRRDAANAVRCALKMQAYLKTHNRDLAERDLPLVGMRIGILTGPMVAGTIGSEERLEYNVHGDTVNTAARLEGFEKEKFVPDHFERPCRILVGALTAEYLGDEFVLEKVGEVPLKGKSAPTAVFVVLGERAAAPVTREVIAAAEA